LNPITDFTDAARKIFDEADWPASEKDIKTLNDRMLLLEERGLTKLNQRLLQGGRKIWDTIAEHNFAVELVLHHPNADLIDIDYEPNEEYRRPIDFKVCLGSCIYWIQVKNLSRLERENRQGKIFRQIETLAKDIKVGKFLCCSLSNDFNEQDIPDLMKFIEEKADTGMEGQEFYFSSTEAVKAKVSFNFPRGKNLSHLVLGMYGDIGVVELTGLSEDQIRSSLCNAAEAFEWQVGNKTINIIVVEADRQKDIDICSAVFGTDFIGVRNGLHYIDRRSNGLFIQDPFSQKVAAVIAMRRKIREPICRCSMLLYPNSHFENLIGDIEELLSFERIVRSNMFPPSDKGGNF
jgi:hypothetical protein